MAKDPAFLFYYNNWIASTKGMDADARGWYITLLAHQAEKGSLPDNLEDLASLADVKFSKYNDFTECWKRTLEAKFTKNESGALENLRLKSIIEDRREYSNKQKLRGIVGSLIKKAIQSHKLKKAQITQLSKELIIQELLSKTTQEREICLKHTLEAFISNANADANKDKDLNQNANDLILYPSFEDFWNLYDKKVGKPGTEKKWNKLLQVTKEQIISHVTAYVKANPDKNFRKDPLKYLNNESWNDEIINKTNNGKSRNAIERHKGRVASYAESE